MLEQKIMSRDYNHKNKIKINKNTNVLVPLAAN